MLVKQLKRSTDYINTIESKLGANVTAYMYSLIANICFPLADYGIRNSSKVPTLQLMFYKSVVGTILGYLYVNSAKLPFYYKSSKINQILLSLSLFSIFINFLLFYGFQRANLSEAISIFQLAPVVTTILGVIMLKENCNFIQVIVIIVSIGGVLLILKPFSFFEEQAENQMNQIIGNLCTLVAAVCFSFSVIFLKQMIHMKIDPQVSTFYLSVLMLIAGSIGMVSQEMKELDTEEIINVAFLCVFNFLANFFISRAFKFGEAGKVVLISYIQIPTGYILDIFFLGNIIELWGTLGVCLVFSGLFAQIAQARLLKRT